MKYLLPRILFIEIWHCIIARRGMEVEMWPSTKIDLKKFILVKKNAVFTKLTIK